MREQRKRTSLPKEPDMRSFLATANVLVAGLVWLLVPALAVLAAPASTDNKPVADNPNDKIRKALEQTISVEYADHNLQAVLDDLSEKTKVRFLADRGNLGPLENAAVTVKLQDAKVATVLRAVLGQMGLSYVIQEGYVLITTEEAAIDRQLRQWVNLNLDEVPLDKALKNLAKNTPANLVLDPRVAKEAKAAPLTLQLENVPLETAVRLMAEMASLKSVRVGNVLFVTTEARADKLRAEEEENNRPAPPAERHKMPVPPAPEPPMKIGIRPIGPPRAEPIPAPAAAPRPAVQEQIPAPKKV
jgi:type II secretory pathway component GspD/PulD (secretin)